MPVNRAASFRPAQPGKLVMQTGCGYRNNKKQLRTELSGVTEAIS